jgi:hypothetical protein
LPGRALTAVSRFAPENFSSEKDLSEKVVPSPAYIFGYVFIKN